LAPNWVSKHCVQLAHEFVNIVHFEQQPVPIVIDQLGIAANARRDDATTAGHCFHQRIGKGLSARGQYKDVDLVEPPGYIRCRRFKVTSRADAKFSSQGFES